MITRRLSITPVQANGKTIAAITERPLVTEADLRKFDSVNLAGKLEAGSHFARSLAKPRTSFNGTGTL